MAVENNSQLEQRLRRSPKVCQKCRCASFTPICDRCKRTVEERSQLQYLDRILREYQCKACGDVTVRTDRLCVDCSYSWEWLNGRLHLDRSPGLPDRT